jgi:malate dehydrogenase
LLDFFIYNYPLMKAKVSIIGAGHVGATTAHLILQSGLADIVLYDIMEGVPQGKALDLAEATPLWGISSLSIGTNDLSSTAGSDIIIITAGLPRKPGMSRDDLLFANKEIITKVVGETSKLSPDSIFIIVTNPMDVMTQVAWKVSGFPAQRVIGMGGILDSSRFRTFISMELGVSAKDVEAVVLGGHGDLMVPLPRFTTVKGITLPELLDHQRIAELIQRTRNGGAEIVALLKTGSAYYAPAASVFEMAKAILLDEKKVLPCAAYLNGEYGISGLFVGVPVILGNKGVEKIIELKLLDEEKKEFNKSAEAVKGSLDKALI